MSDQPYTPTEEQVRDLYVSRWGQHDRGRAVGQFDRFIETVKRDAAREALNGLITDTAIDVRLGTEGNDPQRVQDTEAVMDAAQIYRDTEYTEETP